MKCEKRKIRELCSVERTSVTPKGGEIYNVFSLPAFDDNMTPEVVDGGQVKSGKLVVFPNTILFNKLNVQFRRVWNIGDNVPQNAVSSTEFIPLKPLGSVYKDYLYYALISDEVTLAMYGARRGTSSSQQRIAPDSLFDFEIPCPTFETQKKIGAILKSIDDKIETNKRINDNLEQQAMALYRSMFVDTDNSARTTCRADEFFDISIGKTPPRKEPQWFSDDPNDRVWVSISDMGSCGTFIDDSAEYLTEEAVTRHNVKIVPDNTVILSFKLTVGRVAITDGEVTTNEAIAHFKTDRADFTEYLYCYLKAFNYQTMGSTSSIATAVNSKIIKAMPFVIPTDEEIQNFHAFAGSAFSKIKALQRENKYLAELRDTLLPKLMSGEIDVENVKI